MDRNLFLEFVRATESAAIAASFWIGKGNKKKADKAAVNEMRARLNQMNFCAKVVIGEGKKDRAPELYQGEKLGKSAAPIFDLAVDPLECTDSVAWGRSNAISVIALAPNGSLFSAPDMYMQKIAVGPKAKGKVNLDWSVEKNLKALSKALDKPIDELMTIVLDRPRHEKLIHEIRSVGARVTLISDGDVAGAIATALPDSGIDILFGIGASAEAVLAASALKCLDGEIQGRLWPRNVDEERLAKSSGIKNIKKLLKMDDFVKNKQVSFVATGIIDGPMLKGVRYESKDKIVTHSVIMRNASKTVRFIEAHHRIVKRLK